MDTCHELELLIDHEVAGEATAVESELLLEHLERCAPCSELFDLLGRLRDEPVTGEPPAADFAAMRRAVLRRLAPAAAARPWWRWSFLPTLQLRPALATALVLVAAGGGFAVGQLGARRSAGHPFLGADASADERGLTGEIRQVALRSRRFADTENSPYTFANVTAAESAFGRLRLGFDVSRHLDLELGKDDPLVAEVLAQAIVAPASIGERRRAIGLAESQLDPKVVEALILAMRHDVNLGVRLLAQEKLAQRPGDPAVRRAMLEVLQQEESVQMRFAAVEYLTQNHVEPDLLERAIGASRAPGGQALRVRARDYLTRVD